ncbi:sigma factor-like helix-turn-helix DNA-binding protein [Undibacterium sp. TJN19]|uniref:sigma factor-like helix-turn-helix DNA-binding protein n=1 Tax=Undibacterium sp. TJN19 TaxID=3413055 RepID=UPI003BEF87DC
MALLGIIRRWNIRDQVPLREIARRLGISRNTVRRYPRDAFCALKSQSQPMRIDKQQAPSINMHYSFQAGLEPKLVKIVSSDEV